MRVDIMSERLKITSNEVKLVERTNGTKTLCLTITYTIGGYNGKCQVIDFEDNEYNKKKVIEKLKRKIRTQRNNLKVEDLLKNEKDLGVI